MTALLSVSKRMAVWFLPLLMSLMVWQQQCHGWMSSTQAARFAATSQHRQLQQISSALFSSAGVDSVSMANVSDNHEEEGEKMATSIANWLDAEWMPQEVHIKMGQSAKKSYITCRENGEDDLMTIMSAIADDLTANWAEYDADAFVNAWNIANYASDYMIQLSGTEGCDCNAKIY